MTISLDPGVSYQPAFVGSMSFVASLPAFERAALMIDAETASRARVSDALRSAELLRVVEGRPTRSDVEDIKSAVGRGGLKSIVGVGTGAVLDAMKIAWLELVDEPATARVSLHLVPQESEPYRAFAPFAVVDTGENHRPTIIDSRLGSANVWACPQLAAPASRAGLSLAVLDGVVMCIESILSRRAQPLTVGLGTAAIANYLRASRADAPAQPASGEVAALFVGACIAADAWWSTKLGIVHAIASPLGTRVGLTHDRLHALIGPWSLRMWGTSVRGYTDIAAAMNVPSDRVLEVLDDLRERAQLPATLSGYADWASVEAVLPHAEESKGVQAAPRTVTAEQLRKFARLAWDGRTEEGAGQ